MSSEKFYYPSPACPRHMFLVLLDTPCLQVFDSADEAIFEIEPPDAESEMRAAFDDLT